MSKRLINVEMPDGTIVEDVPEGTSQAEVQRRYSQMKGLHQSTSSAALAPSKSPLQQGFDVAMDQSSEAALGLLSPITGLPGQVQREGFGKTLAGFVTPLGIAKGIWSGLHAVGEDVVPNIVRNSAALIEAYGGPASPFGTAPNEAENKQAATTAGSTTGGLLVAKAIAKLAPELNPSAERLSQTASNLRQPVPKMSFSRFGAAGVIGAGLGQMLGIPWMEGASVAEVVDLIRRNPTVRKTVANGLDKIAQLKVEGEGPGVMNPNVQAIAAAIKEDQAKPAKPAPMAAKAIAEDEASRIRQAPILPREFPDASVNVQRPTTPDFIQQQLEQARVAETPEQLYERMKQVRDADVPLTDSQQQQLSIERPGIPPEHADVISGRMRPEQPPTAAETTVAIDPAGAVNKWLGVKPNDLKFGADPGSEVAARNLIGKTHQETLKNVTAAKVDVGKGVLDQLKAAGDHGVSIDAWDIVSELLDNAKSPIASPTDAAFQAQLNSIGNKIIERFPNLDSLSPLEAQALKVELTKDLNYGGLRPTEITTMLKKMGHDVGEQIKDAIPGISNSYNSWQNLILAERGLKNQVNALRAGRVIKPAAPPTPKP